jgi:hypothetical protein
MNGNFPGYICFYKFKTRSYIIATSIFISIIIYEILNYNCLIIILITINELKKVVALKYIVRLYIPELSFS